MATSSRTIEKSDRLKALPPYLFIEIDKKKRAKIASGADVINLGVGDPDRPTPKFIIDRMAKAIYDPKNHRYPFDEGVPAFKDSAASFMERRFGVKLDPATQILTTIGSKDGIAHLPLAVVNPGDIVLVPSPGYPVYHSGAVFAGGRPWKMDLTEANGYLPDLSAIPEDVASQAKLIWVNYPNNPTAAVAPMAFYESLVEFARKYGIIIASDLAYSETYFDEPPRSILEVPGAMDCAIEMHSLSKTFNMTGWRLGFAAGNREVIAALAQVKGNSDSGQFNAVQWAGKEALDHYDHEEVKAMTETYRQRRDALCDGLGAIGIETPKCAASFFVWGKCPKGMSSMDFVGRVLEEAAVVMVPGGGFGAHCDKYFRAALTVEVDRIREAVERIGKIKW
ncbi:MAG: aminotransferase class I/II-fold pyridoxal phosphate-dependent enzyme [Planctomycetes bacterium]|nr:aminotransferase class I/II-fold pyridoxal phosphate-dependent enzyme [Planctomycetota bacterium]